MNPLLKLHEAIAVVLLGSEGMSMEDVAAAINERGLYRRGDGSVVDADQIRLRTTQSNGQYVHLFEVDGTDLRLA